MEHYRIRVRRGDAELEIDSSNLDYVDTKFAELATWLGSIPDASRTEQAKPSAEQQDNGEATQGASTGKSVSLVEHVRKIGPKTGTQYVIAVGHYLEQYGGMRAGFKTRDLSDAFQSLKYKPQQPGRGSTASSFTGIPDGWKGGKQRSAHAVGRGLDQWPNVRNLEYRPAMKGD